jgi:hypothetical protein
VSGGEETTNNGWPVEPTLSRIYVGGDSSGATFASGDVATAFSWLFGEFHRRVEPVVEINGARTVAFNNSTPNADPGSNHQSGTAGDVNGYKHPYEVGLPIARRGSNFDSGYTSGQIAVVRQILAEAGGLFAWGMDYRSGWRDPMHFDIKAGKTRADVAAFVAKIALTVEDDDMYLIARNKSTGEHSLIAGGRLVARLGEYSIAAVKELLEKAGVPLEQRPIVLTTTAYDTMKALLPAQTVALPPGLVVPAEVTAADKVEIAARTAAAVQAAATAHPLIPKP